MPKARSEALFFPAPTRSLEGTLSYHKHYIVLAKSARHIISTTYFVGSTHNICFWNNEDWFLTVLELEADLTSHQQLMSYRYGATA